MNEKPTASRVKRRGFIGAGLIAAGAAAGVLARRSDPLQRAKAPAPVDSRFAYDTSEFAKTDPALLRYKPAGEFATGFERVTRLITTSAGIWVAGDRAVKLFGPNGKLHKEIALDFRAHCLHATGDDLFVGAKDHYVVLGADNKERFRSNPFGGRTYFTSLCVHDSAIYIADAGNREVIICSRAPGDVIDRFGQKDLARKNPGFAIPSAYFHLAIAPDNRLRIANTGQTRIETYTLDGRFESAWGEPGKQIDRFCGCCNPVYFTMTRQGNFITSEKGLCRINIYSAEGKFIGAVAGPEMLVENQELARRACVDCTVGAAFDVAVDAQNNVFALDPFKKTVRCFAPLNDT